MAAYRASQTEDSPALSTSPSPPVEIHHLPPISPRESLSISVQNNCVLLHSGGGLEQFSADIRLEDMEEGSVLLQTTLSEVCGTDVHLKHGRLNTVPYPIIPGHVSVGTVFAVAGRVVDVDGQEVTRGMSVTFLDVIDTCNSCVSCLVHKASTRCPNRRVMGITCQARPSVVRGLLGGWSTFIYLPPSTKIIRLPPTLPPATFMAAGCGLPTAMHAIERGGVALMDRVVVQGSGPVGLLCAVLAVASGALQVIVIGTPEHRLSVVTRFGIDAVIDIHKLSASERLAEAGRLMGGRMADVVIEATGQPGAVAEGLDLCREGGCYVVVGQYTDNGEVALNPHHQINRKHVTMKGCWGSDFSHFYRGVQFMGRHAKSFPWELMVSAEYGLGEAGKAIQAVQDLTVFKALINPQAGIVF